jgi:pimeloyl-ACP methyl ester carboxylesterase
VLIFPGILSSDNSTSLLRRTLDAAGYHSHASDMGFVTGITPEAFAKAEARLMQVYRQEGRKVVLLGWSLGGLYSRVLAQRHPECVAMVMTLGSPFSGNRRANNAWRLYEAINDHKVDAPKLADDPSVKPPMHTVAVWSPNDGVIAPECAKGLPEERDVEIEVPTRHFAFGAQRQSIETVVRILGEQLPKSPEI